jgi:hypothetical protein
MPEIVAAAFLNRLKPSVTFVLDLMFRGVNGMDALFQNGIRVPK